jgi:hypothetical protein
MVDQTAHRTAKVSDADTGASPVQDAAQVTR